MPRLCSRVIPVFYRPPQVTPQEIERIVTFYARGEPLIEILRRLQYKSEHRDYKSLSYCDLYTILFHAIKENRILERVADSRGMGEVPVTAFPDYFKCCRDGGTADECLATLKPAQRQQVKKNFHIKLFRQLTDRHREYQVLERPQANLPAERKLTNLLFERFRRVELEDEQKRLRPAIMLFTDDIPLEIMNALNRINSSFAKQLMITINPGFVNDLRLTTRPSTADPAEQPFEPSSVYTSHLNNHSDPFNIRKPVGSATESELPDTLSEADMLQEVAAMAQAPQKEQQDKSPISLLSAHQQDSESPSAGTGFDLENLADDDPVESLDEAAGAAGSEE